MSDLPGDKDGALRAEKVGEGPEQEQFSKGAACVFAVGLLLILLYALIFGFGDRDDPNFLWYPLETVLKVAGSDLDAIDSGYAEQGPGVWGRILGIPEDVRQKALDNYAEVLNELEYWYIDWSGLVLRRMVLELEASGWDEKTGSYFQTYSLGPASEVVLRYAYAKGTKPTKNELSDFFRSIGSGNWYADTVRSRMAEREGNPRGSAAARERMSARVARVVAIDRAQQWLSLILGALGVLVLGWWSMRAGPLAEARWTSHWAFGSGLVVSVLATVGYLWYPFFFSAFYLDVLWGGLVALGLIWVLRPKDGPGFRRIFGLAGRPWGLLVSVTVCGILVQQLLWALWAFVAWEELIGWGAYDEMIFWGSRSMVIATLLNSVLFAPFFEELVFRGVFYGTLRTRLSVWPALILSSILFTVWHGYNLEGSVSIFLSGLLFAYLYERSRSLIPPMLLHGFINLNIAIYDLAL